MLSNSPYSYVAHEFNRMCTFQSGKYGKLDKYLIVVVHLCMLVCWCLVFLMLGSRTIKPKLFGLTKKKGSRDVHK